jgi:YbbR domain-containing protein
MMLALRRNFGYKLVSVAIAILLYSIANNQLNPHTINEVYVLPEVVDVPDDMVVRTAPSGFTVTVTGPSAAVGTFKSEPIKATVDVARARLGVNKLPIQYKLPSGELDVGAAPAYAEATLERKVRHDWYVDVQFDNEPPPGYAYMEPETTPRKVSVSGLASEVAQVARVIAVVPRAQSAWDINQTVDLIAQNQRQQTVDTVLIEPTRVQVRLGLRRAPTTKSVLLSAEMQGAPAPGFTIAGYEFRPSMVSVTGTQEALSTRSALTVPVDVTGARASFSRTIHVSPPSGIQYQNAADADVRVQIDVRPVGGVGALVPPVIVSPSPKSPTPAPAEVPTTAPPASGVP